MNLLDVNILVYAHREDAPEHAAYSRWLEAALAGCTPCGISELVLSGFLRIVTHPKIFVTPTPLPLAQSFCEELRNRTNLHIVAPGGRHWDIFTSLCNSIGAKGNAIPDAYHAALAIENGCTWVSSDFGFARFPGLNWMHPLKHE